MSQGGPDRRISRLDVARGLFLAAAIGFGWWGLREYREQIVAALGQVGPERVALAGVLVLAGLAVTGAVWRRILAGYGHHVAVRPAARIFFVGQVGKYIPGSVWSLGAQADMARSNQVPPRTTVAVGLIFLWVHVGTAIPVAALTLDTQRWGLAPWWLRVAVVVVALVGLSPLALARLGDLLARAPEPLRLRWADTGWLVGLMAIVWGLYGAATLLVVPPDPSGGSGAGFMGVVGAFAASYVAGVLMVLAPAGLGAREVTLIALLAPMVGVPAAAATALLVRVLHTVGDFGAAWLAWLLARSMPPRP
jgi:uncharacterized membrane protein YbhN (UPF0104 family)